MEDKLTLTIAVRAALEVRRYACASDPAAGARVLSRWMAASERCGLNAAQPPFKGGIRVRVRDQD